MAERLPDGRLITGGPGNVKARINLTKNEVKVIKEKMYNDFLDAKQKGQIELSYPFDRWLKNSMDTLRTLRKADLETEWKLGKLSRSEYDALDELRMKMISAIMMMDTSMFDNYGVQYIDPTVAQITGAQEAPLDNRLLVPNYRKDKVKFNKIIKS